MPHRHFRELQTAINKRLRVLRPPAWKEQIEKYRWLYGALGDPGAKRMFICENPSLGALQRIRESRLGGPPDFDTQWTGDPAKRHDERFRKVLCGLGLKDGEIWERGGWSCYITNVIKQAAFVRDWNKATRSEKKPTVGEWSEILQMEIDTVRPDVVFCVGGQAHWMVKWLRSNAGLQIPGRVHGIWHYSARRSDEVVERKMRDGIEPYL